MKKSKLAIYFIALIAVAILAGCAKRGVYVDSGSYTVRTIPLYEGNCSGNNPLPNGAPTPDQPTPVIEIQPTVAGFLAWQVEQKRKAEKKTAPKPTCRIKKTAVQQTTPAPITQTVPPADQTDEFLLQRLDTLEQRVDGHDQLFNEHSRAIKKNSRRIANLESYQRALDKKLAEELIWQPGRPIKAIRIGFPAGESGLSPKVQVQIKAAAKRLNQLALQAKADNNKKLYLRIEGCASKTGPADENQRLSDERAKTVGDELQKLIKAGTLLAEITKVKGVGVSYVSVYNAKNQSTYVLPEIK